MWWENPVSKSVWKINTKILHLHSKGTFFQPRIEKIRPENYEDYVALMSHDPNNLGRIIKS